MFVSCFFFGGVLFIYLLLFFLLFFFFIIYLFIIYLFIIYLFIFFFFFFFFFFFLVFELLDLLECLSVELLKCVSSTVVQVLGRMDMMGQQLYLCMSRRDNECH